jgi:MtaA/CmuA family methyltransferase
MGFAYREANDWGLPLIWLEDNVPHPADALVKERADLRQIKFCDPWDGPRMRDRLEAIKLFRQERPEVYLLGNVEGCWAQALSLRGMDQSMMDLVLAPELLRELMDAILPHEIAFAKAQVEVGAESIMLGDSAASLVSQEHYVEFIWPYEKELLGAIRELGATAKLHICGNITRLLPHIAELPVDMVDVDSMVDLKECRRVLGPDLCLWGNFNPVTILLQSTPERVRSECRRCIAESGPRYVLSPGCEVPPDTPADNFAAACEAYEQAPVPGEG